MKEFIKRLSSRKFLLTVAGLALVTAFPDRATEITTFILPFVGIEGVKDTVQAYTLSKYVAPIQKHADIVDQALANDEDDFQVDRSTITPGTGFDRV